MNQSRHPVIPDTRDVPLHLAISQQAYDLWERYGHPAGRDVAIWLEAERQVLGTHREVNQQENGAVPAAALDGVYYSNLPATPAGESPKSRRKLSGARRPRNPAPAAAD